MTCNESKEEEKNFFSVAVPTFHWVTASVRDAELKSERWCFGESLPDLLRTVPCFSRDGGGGEGDSFRDETRGRVVRSSAARER